MSSYNYPISFTSLVNPSSDLMDLCTLQTAINANATINANNSVQFINGGGDTITIVFENALTFPDQIDALDAIISAYVYVAPLETAPIVLMPSSPQTRTNPNTPLLARPWPLGPFLSLSRITKRKT